MSKENKIKPYCKSAIFRCSCCSYSAEIYSSHEWIEKYDTSICSTCKRAYNYHYDIPVIFRSDIDEDIPLHFQGADVPDEYSCCTECSGKEKLHWTEILVACPNCNESESSMPSTMVFEKYVIGKDILTFYKWCCKWQKPSHPLLEFIDQKGHLHLGPYSEFSAN